MCVIGTPEGLLTNHRCHLLLFPCVCVCVCACVCACVVLTAAAAQLAGIYWALIPHHLHHLHHYQDLLTYAAKVLNDSISAQVF